jgi:hypothetical protein
MNQRFDHTQLHPLQQQQQHGQHWHAGQHQHHHHPQQRFQKPVIS